ncbi:MAG: heat-shock protein, partial [Actinomycetota bacterium]|nr:heat-shock protein [Actinomycetota bacterium]
DVERANARAASGSRIFAAGARGDIMAMRPGERPPRMLSSSQALVVWRPSR